MPPTTGASITPTLGRMPKLGPSGMDRRGQALLTFIILTVTVSAVYVAFIAASFGDARILVMTEDGVRTIETISLGTGERTVTARDTEINASIFNTFYMQDGTLITVDSPGIVRKNGTDVESTVVLVASPVPATNQTPLAVWNDAARIAWVSPSDGSLQVFEQNARGAYVPLFVDQNLSVESLQFAKDGQSLVVSIAYGAQSEVAVLSLTTGELEPVAAIPGFVSVLP